MANILTKFFTKTATKPNQEEIKRNSFWSNPILGTLNYLTLNDYTESKALKLSAVYRAVSVISDSVAILPLDTYQYKDNWKYKQYNDLYYLLNVQPNNIMSAYTFKKNIVQSILLKGNAYIKIIRNNQFNITSFELLDSDFIQVLLIKDKELKYKDSQTGKIYDSSDIIHIMNYSNNGMVGVSTLTYAAMSLETAYNSEQHANNFFKGGGNMAGILKPVAGVNITKDKAINAKAAFMNALDTSLNTTAQSNSIIVLDSGLEYQQITVNPKDSQLLESRQFNILSIAQYFGVPLSKLFDKSATSYASSEAEQIDFLNSTLLPLLEKIELEFYRKIFTRVEYDMTELKFDVSNLLRLDAQTQATVFSQLFQIGVVTPNEIREKLNSNFPVKNGNRSFVQQNVQPIDNLLNDIKNNNDTNNQ